MDTIVEVVKPVVKEALSNPGQLQKNKSFIEKHPSIFDTKTLLLILVFIIEIIIAVLESLLTKKCD